MKKIVLATSILNFSILSAPSSHSSCIVPRRSSEVDENCPQRDGILFVYSKQLRSAFCLQTNFPQHSLWVYSIDKFTLVLLNGKGKKKKLETTQNGMLKTQSTPEKWGEEKQ